MLVVYQVEVLGVEDGKGGVMVIEEAGPYLYETKAEKKKKYLESIYENDEDVHIRIRSLPIDEEKE